MGAEGVVASGEAHRAEHVEAVVPRGEARLLAVQVLVRTVEERAACEREAREGVDGRVCGRLVTAVFHGRVAEAAVPAQPDEGALVDASCDVGDVGLRGRRRIVHAHALAVLIEDG